MYPGISLMRSRSNLRLVFRILKIAEEGATKAEIISNIPSLSYSQLRKIMAELTDKDYLRPDPNDNNRYITSHKGHNFLENALKE